MYIGIDLGGTNIAGAIVNDSCEILVKESIKTNAQRPAEKIIRDMAGLCYTLIEKGGYSLSDIQSVGLGTPGAVDRKKGEIVFANNLPFVNVPAQKLISQIIDKPVYLENDANCAALGEYMVLEGRETIDCFAAITLGTGVGSGVILDGKIFTGGGAAVEFGHTVVQMDGKLCTCQRRGCLEQYASATALIEQTKEAMRLNPNTLMWERASHNFDHVNGRTAFAAARDGDETALKVVNQYIRYVGIGLANLTNTFQPQLIVISGGISKEGDFLIQPLQEYVKENFYCKQAFRTQVKAATLLNDAGIVGAAFLGNARKIL